MLSLRDVHTYYGDSHVLQGISLDVERGQCVSVLGRNGAGKSTTMRSILGLTPAREGTIVFDSVDITREPTFRIVRRGIGYVPENRGIFRSLTVDEHLALAVRFARRRDRGYSVGRIYELFPRLHARRRSFGDQLSGGEQQMLAIGRALLLNPELLVLDEPSEGLAPTIVEFLEEVLREIKGSGTPILLVEQNYDLATSLADFVYVLSQGQVKFAGTADDLAAAERVREVYLGV